MFFQQQNGQYFIQLTGTSGTLPGSRTTSPPRRPKGSIKSEHPATPSARPPTRCPMPQRRVQAFQIPEIGNSVSKADGKHRNRRYRPKRQEPAQKRYRPTVSTTRARHKANGENQNEAGTGPPRREPREPGTRPTANIRTNRYEANGRHRKKRHQPNGGNQSRPAAGQRRETRTVRYEANGRASGQTSTRPTTAPGKAVPAQMAETRTDRYEANGENQPGEWATRGVRGVAPPEQHCGPPRRWPAGPPSSMNRLVGEEGFEPSRPFGHTDLNRARLPFRHPPWAGSKASTTPSAPTPQIRSDASSEGRCHGGSSAALRATARGHGRGRLRTGFQV